MFNLRKILFLAAIVLSLPTLAQEHELGSWTSAQINKSLAHGWSLGARGEMRRCAELRDLDLAFLRFMVNYNITDWLNAEAAVDRQWLPSTYQNRMLLSLTAAWKPGAFGLSFRQRYVLAHTHQVDQYKHLMRSTATASYHIGESAWTPYASVEFFYWDQWQMTHTFVGAKVKLDAHNTLDLYYVCNIKANNAPVIHSLGVGYYYKF